jgi:hypothetical protein
MAMEQEDEEIQAQEEEAAEPASNTVVEEVEVGDALMSWETWEFPPHERSRVWFIVMGILCVVCLVYAFSSANFLFAVVILMFVVITMVNMIRKPQRLPVHVTTLGIVLGNEFFPYDDIKDFSIVYKPPVKTLYLDFKNSWKPLTSIPLEEIDPNQLREQMLAFVFENLDRDDESLTDTIARLYKM